MPLEVELKFAVADRAALLARLAGMQAAVAAPVVQVDCYFAHPARDFAATDEALRLRRVGETNYITYKGPKLDASTKTRREIELRLDSGDDVAAQARMLCEALGFVPVAEVVKRRSVMHLRWQDQPVEVAIDTVDKLGDFVELEILAEPHDLDRARGCLIGLAQQLGLSDTERRSYLELLLAGPS